MKVGGGGEATDGAMDGDQQGEAEGGSRGSRGSRGSSSTRRGEAKQLQARQRVRVQTHHKFMAAGRQYPRVALSDLQGRATVWDKVTQTHTHARPALGFDAVLALALALNSSHE